MVAAKKERIGERTMVIEHSGRTPAVVDVEAFALANAYQMNYLERTDALTALTSTSGKSRNDWLRCSSAAIRCSGRHIPIGGRVARRFADAGR